jgi:hypothetical protein
MVDGSINVGASFSDNFTDIIYDLFHTNLSAKEHRGPWYLGLPKPSKQGANAEADPTGLQDPALANLGRSVCVYAQAAGCGLQLIGACVWRNSTVRADTPGPGQLECIVIVSAAW